MARAQAWTANLIGALCAVIAVPAAAAQITHQTVDEQTEVIVLSGEIEFGDEEQFRDLALKYPDAIIALDSPGGALIPALEIGKLINLREYATIVFEDRLCTSSCALIWIAGSPRLIETGARVGFHASYRDEGGKLVETGVGNALVGHYLSQLSLPQRAAIFATSASPDRILWLDESNKDRSGIAFDIFRSRNDQVEPDVVVEPPKIVLPSSRAKISLADSLKATLNQPGFSLKAARSLGFTAPNDSIVADHLSKAYKIPGLLDRLAMEVESANLPNNDPSKSEAAAREIAASVSVKLAYLGLTRLSNSDVKRFFGYLGALPDYVTNAECRSIFYGNTAASGVIEFNGIARMGQESLADYLSLMRKGMEAELAGVRSRVVLNQGQTQTAETAGESATVAAFSGVPEARRQKMLTALTKPNEASDSDLCDAYRILMPTVANMDGIAGDWYRRVWLGYITEEDQ